MGPTMTALARGGGPEHWGDGGAGGWWPIFPILWVALLVGVAVTIAILYARRTRSTGPLAAAEAQLAERYARGEIDETEYRERRDVLRKRR
ncbi:MAG TPA: SHOCT domain-containing protein [Natronosporangium sp.]